MNKKVITYNLENSALASLCEAKFKVERDMLTQTLEADISIITSTSPSFYFAPFTVVIANSKSNEKVVYGELTVNAYYMLKDITVSDIDIEEDEYYKPLVSFSSADDNFYPLITLSSGEVISFIKKENDGLFVVIPALKSEDNLGSIIQKLLKDYKKVFNNKKSDSYELPPKFKRLIDKNKETLDKCHKEIDSIEEELKRSYPEYFFLKGLISTSDSILSESISLFLNFIGFNYEDEDLYSLSSDEKFFVSSSSSPLFSFDYSSLFQKINKAKRGDKEVTFRGLYILNSQKYLSLDKREALYSPEDEIALKNKGVAITTTKDLLKAYSYLKEGFIDKEFIINAIKEDGYVTFSFPKEKEIGVVNKVSSQDEQICRLSLENKPIRKGMSIIIENSNGELKKAKITKLQVGKVLMAEAVEGDVTLALDCQIKVGNKLYYI